MNFNVLKTTPEGLSTKEKIARLAALVSVVGAVGIYGCGDSGEQANGLRGEPIESTDAPPNMCKGVNVTCTEAEAKLACEYELAHPSPEDLAAFNGEAPTNVIYSYTSTETGESTTVLCSSD
jgi:hypothetical protein